MGILRNRLAVLLLSPCAGVMYATLFTMPYLLVAHYHSSERVSWMPHLYYFVNGIHFRNVLTSLYHAYHVCNCKMHKIHIF